MALLLFGLRGLMLCCGMHSTYLDTQQSTMTVLLFLAEFQILYIHFYVPICYLFSNVESGTIQSSSDKFFFIKSTVKYRILTTLSGLHLVALGAFQF